MPGVLSEFARIASVETTMIYTHVSAGSTRSYVNQLAS